MKRDGEPEAMSATQFVLLLHSVHNLGEKTLTRVLVGMARERLVPEAFLRMNDAELCDRFDFDARQLAYWRKNHDTLVTQSAEAARTLRRFPVQVRTFASATYPVRVERFDDAPPPILYTLGCDALLQTPMPSGTRFTFAIAVSNSATPATLKLLEQAAGQLIGVGGVPVTGHDRTPYQRTALMAQRQNRPVVYVFDRGLREALGPEFDRPPFAAARIRDVVFDLERDVALSPFRLDDHGLGANNRRRDRLVFALADVIVALDVAPGGTMEKECCRAHEQGRKVIVADGGREGNDRLRSLGCLAFDPNATNVWGTIAVSERQ